MIFEARNTCYYCRHYGKCKNVVKACGDWQAWDYATVCLGVGAFDMLWRAIHKRPWERYDPAIMDERAMVNADYLAGNTEEEAVIRLSDTMAAESGAS